MGTGTTNCNEDVNRLEKPNCTWNVVCGMWYNGLKVSGLCSSARFLSESAGLWMTRRQPVCEERRSSMSLTEKTIQCSDCNASFTFSASEQELFASRGFTNDPKRCPACRAAKREQRGDTGSNSMGYQGQGTQRQMF